MSHAIGRIVTLGVRIGPDAGPPTAPGVWEFLFTPSPASAGGDPRAVIPHFTAMSFPAGGRLEVDLRYGVDTFSSGADAWTRPVDPRPGHSPCYGSTSVRGRRFAPSGAQIW